MEILIVVFLFILGASLTSFYTVVGMRVPKNESINGRSHCDHCKKTIPSYALIPVLGYLFTKGRCPYCKNKVSIKYPLYEFIGGLLFGIGYIVLGSNLPEYIVYVVMVSLLIIVTVSDIEYKIVPDVVLLTFLPILFVLRMLYPMTVWYEHVLGAILGFAFMYFIAWYGKKRFKRDALGGGDIKLYFLIGLFLGMQLVFLSLFFASILGIIFGKVTMKKINPIPFVPFIFGGVLLAYYIGPTLLQWYIGLF